MLKTRSVTHPSLNGSNTDVYTYDSLGNLATVADALGHTTTYSSYTLLGLPGQISGPNGDATNYTYDARGRVASIVRHPNGVAATWTYTYDGFGLPASVTAPDNLVSGITRNAYMQVTYTPEGWITGRGFSIGGTNYALGYSYDSVGHVASVVYPDGNNATYSYTNGAVSGVTFTVGGTSASAVSAVTYRPGGTAMASWTSSNGLTNTLVYDSDGRLGSINVPGVQNLAFTYDAADRITQITNGLDGSMTETLGYDAMSHLTTETSGADNESYTYDAAGNRTHQVVNSNTTTYSMAATSNRLATLSGTWNTTWGYDAEGAITTANGTVVYQYDPFHRLVNANGTSYVIGPEGQRFRKMSASGVTTYFAPDRSGTLLAEDQSGTWMDYVWLNGRLVAAIVNGGKYPVHADQTGRPMAVTDPNTRAVVWQAHGLPFTSQVTTNVWRTFNLGFPGQYQDTESGMWQNGERDYNPYIGRYVESDPIGLAGGINTYAYVGNNPLTLTDRSGLRADTDLCAGMSARGCMQLGEQFAPDYTQVSGSWYIFSASLSASGDTLFGSFNISRNYTNLENLFKPSFSADVGFLNSRCEDLSKRRRMTDNLLHGFSMSAGAYYYAGATEVYSPGSGTATQFGLGMGITATPSGGGVPLLQYGGNGN